MKRYFTKEVIIGIITIISLFILYFGFNFLKGINIFKPTNHYYVRMANVTELQKSCAVYVDGFKVGLVNDIRYDYEHPGNIIVLISLEKGMKVQVGSYVELSSSLTGGASLSFKLNTHVTSYCHVGDTIEGVMKLGMMEQVAEELLPQMKDLLPRLDTILYSIQKIVAHPVFFESLDNISRITANLEMTSGELNKIVSNDIPVILRDFRTISSNVSQLTDNLNKVDLQSTMNLVNATVKNMEMATSQFNNKESSLGLLMNDRQLYDNLNSTANNASLLLEDLRKNPKRYVHFSVF
ncbi:MAG: MlaD family protein [Dysgonamonadaceae bacterium]|nr:MlaD family protein [Dysgonamonadaceae bacterium]